MPHLQSDVFFVLQDQWGHLEDIELVNDGSGLGFGIVGGKTSGVVVRTLIPDSVADRVSPRQELSFFTASSCCLGKLLSD